MSPRFAVEAEPLPGVLLLRRIGFEDARGRFERLFCAAEMAELGIARPIVQANLSTNPHAGTFRGLHYQLPPSAETKTVTCLAGAVFDVVLDLRPGTFGRIATFTLRGGDGLTLVIPEGCAHGFLTLEPNSTLLYFASAPWDPQRERGIRFDDPAFRIPLPFRPRVVSERDRSHPDFDLLHHLGEDAPCACS